QQPIDLPSAHRLLADHHDAPPGEFQEDRVAERHRYDASSSSPALVWVRLETTCSRSLSLAEPSSCTEQWIPHSLSVCSSHHQRPARSDCPGSTGRVHGAHPIDVYPWSNSSWYGTSCCRT